METPMSAWLRLFAALLLAGSAAAQAQATPEDIQDLLRQAALQSMFEARAAQIASQKAMDPQVQGFANELLEDHARAHRRLSVLAEARGVVVPIELDESRGEKISLLFDEQRGESFDDGFVELISEVHDDARAVYEPLAAQSADAELQRFAREQLKTLHEHRPILSALNRRAPVSDY